ncbi:hypothetical protein DQ04_03931010 [Trypanosoma grayi]|uniref:hypothetical protein n=1 Tax=Trypanosoma grayi TaxID=71804 RepID=UPI0004F45FA3|nr:hypothetical protein DQ04_03931010 [Trypanosoma grayi]KEG10283.1 hypothetical protein DQ04_03931010 [Trypanosoma grayi]
MPVDWSSSSSDEDLRTALRRNARVREGEERALPTSISLSTVYNGETVDVRCGTIYCPLRKRYFHIRSVKQNAAAFFGDGNLRRCQRRYLSPSSVELLDASHGEEVTDECRRVTLAECDDKGFYLFGGIKGSPSCTPKSTATPPMLQDFRFFRIAMESRFRDILMSPMQLRDENNTWKHLSYQIPPGAAVASLPDGRFVFGDLNSQPRLCVVQNDMVQTHQLEVSRDGGCMVGMHFISHHAVVIVRRKRLEHLTWDPDEPSAPRAWSFSPLSDEHSCSCLSSSFGEQMEPFVVLGSGRRLLYAVINNDRPPQLKRLRTFHTTPVLSVDTYSAGPLANQGVLCGMQNGTIQFQPLQVSETRRPFNSIVRHKSCVSYVRCVQNTFNFVSVASDGGVKLWDLRYMSAKEPVTELKTGTTRSPFFGAQATFADDILCVTTSDGRICCLNTRKWLILGQYRRADGGEGRLHLLRSSFGYQILDTSSHSTMSLALHVVYSRCLWERDVLLLLSLSLRV